MRLTSKITLLMGCSTSVLGQLTIPIQKTQLSAPVTKTQKMVTEFHEHRLMQQALERKEEQGHDDDRHVLQAQHEIELLNQVNMAYTGPIYFGTPLQTPTSSNFVYDTGSGYLTTTSTSCSNCRTSQYYDPSTSTTAKVVSTGTKKLEYGSATLYGYMGSDQVCLSTDTCVSDFEFFVITSQSGLNGNDGILGLSPIGDSANGPSYMQALSDQGIIDEQIATFELNFYGDADSYVYLGQRPASVENQPVWKQSVKRSYDTWWTVRMSDVLYGETDIKNSGDKLAILDTGTTLMYVGQSDYYSLIDELVGDVPDLDCTSDIYCFTNKYSCDEITPKMSNLVIRLGENTYSLPPAAYVYSRSNLYQKKCTVAISYQADSQGMFILGDSFLRNFITTFDYSNNSMELVINPNAPAGVTVEYHMGGWKIAAIVLGSILGLLLIVWLVCCCCKRAKKNRTKLAMERYQVVGAGQEPLAQGDAEIAQEGPSTKCANNGANSAYKDRWANYQQ